MLLKASVHRVTLGADLLANQFRRLIFPLPGFFISTPGYFVTDGDIGGGA